MTDLSVAVAPIAAGCVEVGVPPRGPGAHFFPVFGGLVGVDVGDLDHPPFASLVDVTRAAWWLEAVYGDAVAAAAVALAPDPDDHEPDGVQIDLPEPVTVELRPGHLWTPLVRFGIGTWIQRWWPSSDAGPRVRLDETLMELENGVLAWTLEFVLGGTSAAAELLGGHVEDVLDTLGNRSPDDALFGPALRAIIESVPVSDEQHAALTAHESRLSLVAVESAALTDDAFARLYDDELAKGPARPARNPLSTRGARLGPLTFAVDVEQVPARSVSWAPNAVSGSLRVIGKDLEVSVEIRAGDVPTDQPLFARVYLDEDVAPAGVVDLARAGGMYGGTVRLLGRALPTDFTLDVFTPSLMTSPDPARAARLRAAVAPIFETLVDAARGSIEAVPVQELMPSAPWRALVAGSARRG